MGGRHEQIDEHDELARIKADRSGGVAVELLHSLDAAVVRRTVQALSGLTDGSHRWTKALVEAGAISRLIAVARYISRPTLAPRDGAAGFPLPALGVRPSTRSQSRHRTVTRASDQEGSPGTQPVCEEAALPASQDVQGFLL
jgi:hypothetical protein